MGVKFFHADRIGVTKLTFAVRSDAKAPKMDVHLALADSGVTAIGTNISL
jgi:hypothetical protein